MPYGRPAWRLATAGVLITLYALALWQGAEQKRGGWGSASDFGYTPDPAGAAEFLQSLDVRFFSDAAPDAMAKAEEVDTFLWRPLNEACLARYGEPFSPGRQLNGSCVAWGAMHAVWIAESIEWQLGNRSEPPVMPSTESIYGGSRVEARGKPGDGARPVGGWSDGSTGYAAAKWLRDWGVIYRKDYGDGLDLRTYSKDVEKRWGAYGNGGEGDGGRFDKVAAETPCRHVVAVKTWAELVAAITSGFPVTIASSQGFTKTRDADGFCQASGTWMHQMCIAGIRFQKNGGGGVPRDGALIVNSWGDYCRGGKWPSDQPDGTFWAERRTVERILSQGDCWAIAEVEFQWRDIRHDRWLGIEP